VGEGSLQSTLANVLARLGIEHAVVVHGADGMGEVSLAGPTEVIEVTGHTTRAFTWRPEDFGLQPAGKETMRVDGPEASAAIISSVLDGAPGPCRDVVVLNAAAALWTAGTSARPADCAQRAAAAIDRGDARRLLNQWIAASSGQ
jgi:anthranilate phosphoribosyltransferase